MKTYKFTIEETAKIDIALSAACYYAKKELECSIELHKKMACKSIVDRDREIYETLCTLRDIAIEHTQIKIEGD